MERSKVYINELLILEASRPMYLSCIEDYVGLMLVQ